MMSFESSGTDCDEGRKTPGLDSYSLGSSQWVICNPKDADLWPVRQHRIYIDDTHHVFQTISTFNAQGCDFIKPLPLSPSGSYCRSSSWSTPLQQLIIWRHSLAQILPMMSLHNLLFMDFKVPLIWPLPSSPNSPPIFPILPGPTPTLCTSCWCLKAPTLAPASPRAFFDGSFPPLTRVSITSYSPLNTFSYISYSASSINTTWNHIYWLMVSPIRMSVRMSALQGSDFNYLIHFCILSAYLLWCYLLNKYTKFQYHGIHASPRHPKIGQHGILGHSISSGFLSQNEDHQSVCSWPGVGKPQPGSPAVYFYTIHKPRMVFYRGTVWWTGC